MTAPIEGKDALAAALNRAQVYGEYLHSICDAYEAWKKAVDHPPGSGISDPDYTGPSDDEVDAAQEEVGALWNALTDAIEEVCNARGEP